MPFACLQVAQPQMLEGLFPVLIRQCPWTRTTCCSRLWQCRCRFVQMPPHACSAPRAEVAIDELLHVTSCTATPHHSCPCGTHSVVLACVPRSCLHSIVQLLAGCLER